MKRPTASSELGRQYRNRRAALPSPLGQPCPFCGLAMWPDQRLQTDHVIPRVFGGADSPLRWAHGSCNQAEGGRIGSRLRSQPRRPKPNTERFG